MNDGRRALFLLGLAFIVVSPRPATAQDQLVPSAESTDEPRVFALGTTFAKGYGLLGVVSRIRPVENVAMELGVGLRPWIIELSGCYGNELSDAGLETIVKGNLAYDFLNLRGKHHLGVELGGGFSTQSGPSVDGAAFYEIFFTPKVSMQVVLGAIFWPDEERYNRRFFKDTLNADYDEMMACYGDAELNTFSQHWGILWGLGMNFYLF